MVTPVVIREVTRADRAAIAFSFNHLGKESLHQRFFTPISRPARREIDRLIMVDHWHQEALIAFASEPRTPVGVAEYVRLEVFDVAEAAVAVVDRWQHQGVGHALLEALRVRALGAGVRHFEITMLRGNKAALALAHRLGPCTPRAARHTLLELVVDLQ